jgi:hypothetical protein
MRDPTTAALLGILPIAAGFGYDSREATPNVGSDPFGRDVGEVVGSDFGVDFGMVHYGADVPFGAEALAPTAAPPNPNNPANHPALMQAWQRQNSKAKNTAQRMSLLSPNADSDIKIEKYIFSLNPSQFGVGSGLTWGTANSWVAFKNPQVAFRAERLFVNVNIPGLVYLATIQAANVQAQVGSTADGYTFSAFAAAGSHISLPTLPPQNTMQVTGTWTNVVPAPFTIGVAFTLALDFQGWATMNA